MKKLWSFYWDCGCQGYVEGIFIATEAEVSKAIGCEVYFGEILGKHSDVYGTVEEGEIKELKVSQSTVTELLSVIGRNISGYNPLDYIEPREMCEKCEDFYEEGESNLYVTDDGKIICESCVDEYGLENLKPYVWEA